MQNEIKITITETEFTAIPIYIEGIVARANAIHSGRIYSSTIMEREIKKLAALVGIPKEFLNNGSESQVGPGAVSKTDGPLKGDGVRFPHDP